MKESEDIFLDLQQKLEGFSALAGTGCIWKVSNYLVPEPDLPGRCGQHTCEFCTAVKSRNSGRGETRCVYHDTREITGRLSQHPTPFVSSCHAGAVEVVVPLPPETTEYAGAVLLGPFRPEGGSCRYPELEPLFRKLPVLPESAAGKYGEFVTTVFAPAVQQAYSDSGSLLPRRPRDRRIAEALAILRQHAQENPSAANVAERLFLSPSRLLHLFQAECGIGFGEYLRKLRLRRARRFLLAADWPIGRVAEASGFPDQSHFTAMFRREFGMPPLQYRKKFGRGGHTA